MKILQPRDGRGRPLGSRTAVSGLYLSAEQKTKITEIQPASHIYDEDNSDSQQQLKDWRESQGLQYGGDRPLDSRWRAVWTTSWDTSRGRQKRILFQCACGIDPGARSTKKSGELQDRRIPFAFTGCLAHAEFTERESTGAISRISGYWTHNDGCLKADMDRLPNIPLHPDVYRVALQQLTDGANITSVQSKNRQMLSDRAYAGMATWDPRTSNVRYHFLPTDHTSLYRQFSRQNGVDVRKQPQYNIDDWLNRDSGSYNPTLDAAIFYYRARSEAGERLKVCISTTEMTAAAWEFAHHSQLVLDGTFGICSSRLLLFIALARNGDGKGVPLAFFLFSAPAGNQATHAGYNTEILAELLGEWHRHLEKNRPKTSGTTLSGFAATVLFEPYTVITDTDTKERGALLRTWPRVLLLLCKFHLRQCWTNHRKTALPNKKNLLCYLRTSIVSSLQSLEVALIATISLAEAFRLVESTRGWLKQCAQTASDDALRAATAGGLKHLDYLVDNWLSEELWKSWSEYGRIEASKRLGIAVEGVIPTTNHLESFNGLLKRKHLALWLHSGHRLRVDTLIALLVTKILPDVYSHLRAQKEYKDWLIQRFEPDSTGQSLYARHQDVLKSRALNLSTANAAICYWQDDEARDRGAMEITLERRLVSVQHIPNVGYLAECSSSTSRWNGILSSYRLAISYNGKSGCTCPDFENRGGACKHLRALQLAIYMYIQQGLEKGAFVFPQTAEEAVAIATLPVSPPGEPEPAPSVPLPLDFSAYDLAGLQQLGGDSTTDGNTDGLDGDGGMDEGTEELSSEDEDGNIVDAESESDGGEVEISQQQTNRNAIGAQLRSKLAYEGRNLLPLLQSFASLVDSSKEYTDIDTLIADSQLMEIAGIAAALASKLGGLHHEAPALPAANLTTAEAIQTSPRGRTQKRTRPQALFAPSPERRQRRKDSHAPL
ncbi:hypothetical protein D9611_015003 [Ephemerocybe angulata]|uniref:SWIM-type domain-containing protein n=1 Tax=Ephemerocybe angulata TaxID=980116 RepID=A0A8H5ERC1_9AGAR|nr:hypothetical protein D9611_015003 [Tulosesus angulatus]